MAATTEVLKSLTDVALYQFCMVYEKVIDKHWNVAAPEANDLLKWMREEIYDEACGDDDVKIVSPAPQEQKVTLTPSKPSLSSRLPKIDSRDLKKITMKQSKTNKDGESKEIDVMINLPYMPHCVDYSNCCQALKVNGNLFTPCMTRPQKGEKYCKPCAKDLKYGTLEDREKQLIGKYTDPNGKKEISYGTWLRKRGIERSLVEELLNSHFGTLVTIPESYFEVNKSKARRSVKSTSSASSEDEETSSVEEDTSVEQAQEPVVTATTNNEPATETKKKRRGRPSKKAKPVVEKDDDDEEKEEEPSNTIEEKPIISAPEIKPQADDDEEDDEGYTKITYKGEVYMYDNDDYTLIKTIDDEVTIVGEWNPETNQPEFSDGYEP